MSNTHTNSQDSKALYKESLVYRKEAEKLRTGIQIFIDRHYAQVFKARKELENLLDKNPCDDSCFGKCPTKHAFAVLQMHALLIAEMMDFFKEAVEKEELQNIVKLAEENNKLIREDLESHDCQGEDDKVGSTK